MEHVRGARLPARSRPPCVAATQATLCLPCTLSHRDRRPPRLPPPGAQLAPHTRTVCALSLRPSAQFADAFNQPLSFDTSNVKDMSYMFEVRSSRPLCPPICSRAPSTARCMARAVAARRFPPPTQPAACPVPCPYRKPCCWRPSAVRVGLQPAAQLRYVPRHRHGRSVLCALFPAACHASQSAELRPPLHAARTTRSLAASRLPARSSPRAL